MVHSLQRESKQLSKYRESYRQHKKMEKRTKVVQAIDDRGKASIKEIAKATQLTKSRVREIIQILKQENVLQGVN